MLGGADSAFSYCENKLKKPKTKDMQSLISGLGFTDVLFVTHEVNANEYLASRNLYHVDVRDCLDVDPVSLDAFETVVITQEALKYFENLPQLKL